MYLQVELMAELDSSFCS